MNNHKFTDLTINTFFNSQYIDETSIKCDKCNNNKNYKFYIDSKGNKFCPLCLVNYKNDILLDYKYRFIMCTLHHKKYISYCKKCNKNLCIKCEEGHKNHKIKSYKEMKPNEKRKNELKNEKIKMNEYKNELEKEFKILKNNLNDLINESIYNLDIYNKIYNNLINNSEDLNNYENIMNILNFKCKNY